MSYLMYKRRLKNKQIRVARTAKQALRCNAKWPTRKREDEARHHPTGESPSTSDAFADLYKIVQNQTVIRRLILSTASYKMLLPHLLPLGIGRIISLSNDIKARPECLKPGPQ